MRLGPRPSACRINDALFGEVPGCNPLGAESPVLFSDELSAAGRVLMVIRAALPR